MKYLVRVGSQWIGSNESGAAWVNDQGQAVAITEWGVKNHMASILFSSDSGLKHLPFEIVPVPDDYSPVEAFGFLKKQ